MASSWVVLGIGLWKLLDLTFHLLWEVSNIWNYLTTRWNSLAKVYIIEFYTVLLTNQSTWVILIPTYKDSLTLKRPVWAVSLIDIWEKRVLKKNREAKMKKKCISLAILVLVFFNSMNPSRAMSEETNSSISMIADDNELEFLDRKSVV